MYISIYFFLNCLILLSGYYSLNKILYRYTDNYKTLDNNKKLYVLKNILKSFSLLYLFLIRYDGYIMIYNNNYINENVYKYSCNYVANDFLGLILNNKLPITTKCHHITTVLLLTYMINQNINDSLFSKLIFTYGACSNISFLVNMHLGTRHILKNKKLQYDINKFSYYSYKFSLSFNLLLHTWILYYNQVTLGSIIYLISIIPLINDDIVLIKWLKKGIIHTQSHSQSH